MVALLTIRVFNIHTGEKPFQNESFGIVTWTLFQPAICDPDSGTDAVHQNIFIYYKI